MLKKRKEMVAMMKDEGILKHLKVGLKEASYVSRATLTVLWTGLWSFARKHPFLTGAFLVICLFIVIGIVSEPNRKSEMTSYKALSGSQLVESIEDLPDVKQIKSEFSTFVVNNTKIKDSPIIDRVAVNHAREVSIWLKEPKIFASLTDDQFKEMSRFIALNYGKLMDNYLVSSLEYKKNGQLETTFCYYNELDESLPKVPYQLAASRYTYVIFGKHGRFSNERLKTTSMCIEKYQQDNAVRKAVVSARESFRYKLINEYKLSLLSKIRF